MKSNYTFVKAPIKFTSKEEFTLEPFRIWDDAICIFSNKKINLGKIENAKFEDDRLTIITNNGEFILSKKRHA